jgi:HD-like signal output (HDOD) protein
VDSQLTPDALAAKLEHEIQARLGGIAAPLTDTERTPDTVQFLASVRDANVSTIRQAPVAAQRALAKTRNPEIGIGQLVQVIEEDPTLGQALLRYANSAYYNTGGSVVVSLKQAAQRVGASGVHNVVLAGMLDGMLCRPGGEYQTMVDAVRGHLVRTASISRSLAKAFTVPADDAFALGLLHDAGKLIVFDVIGTMRHDARRDLRITRHVVSDVLRHLHEMLGGLAALRWGLGVEVAQSISTHHRMPAPERADRMSELLFISLDVPAWWEEGQIPGTPERAGEVLRLYSTDAAEAA